MKDGGQAFPHQANQGEDETCVINGGMSLRDFFAASALQGIVGINKEAGQIGDLNEIAEFCYLQAAAMLDEREKP